MGALSVKIDMRSEGFSVAEQAGAGDPRADLEWAFDALGVGLMLLDTWGDAVFANRAAQTILAQRDGLYVHRHGLAASNLAATRALQDMIQLLTTKGAAPTFRLRLERPSGERPLLLTLMRVPAVKPPLAPGAVVAVFIHDTSAAPRIQAVALAEAYGLTPRESQVAVLLGEGAGPASIAHSLQLGLGTVRNHLKSIFLKTGSRTQLALSAIVRSFADPLAQ
jgi:DNA-binding CsgD family transcriptional regulator